MHCFGVMPGHLPGDRLCYCASQSSRPVVAAIDIPTLYTFWLCVHNATPEYSGCAGLLGATLGSPVCRISVSLTWGYRDGVWLVFGGLAPLLAVVLCCTVDRCFFPGCCLAYSAFSVPLWCTITMRRVHAQINFNWTAGRTASLWFIHY